jgi:hypothetical protein
MRQNGRILPHTLFHLYRALNGDAIVLGRFNFSKMSLTTVKSGANSPQLVGFMERSSRSASSSTPAATEHDKRAFESVDLTSRFLDGRWVGEDGRRLIRTVDDRPQSVWETEK